MFVYKKMCYELFLFNSIDLTTLLGNDEIETRKTTALTTVITGLRKFTNYSLQVLAFTKIGDGVLTTPSYCQTEEDGKRQTDYVKNKIS